MTSVSGADARPGIDRPRRRRHWYTSNAYRISCDCIRTHCRGSPARQHGRAGGGDGTRNQPATDGDRELPAPVPRKLADGHPADLATVTKATAKAAEQVDRAPRLFGACASSFARTTDERSPVSLPQIIEEVERLMRRS